MPAKKNKKVSKKPIKKVVAKPASLPHDPVSKKNTTGIIPLGDRVLIKPLSSDQLVTATSFGIVIPETVDKEKPEQGEVIAVGPGRYIDGVLVAVHVAVGDRVIFSRYAYDDIKVAGEEYYMLKEDNILAIIK